MRKERLKKTGFASDRDEQTVIGGKGARRR